MKKLKKKKERKKRKKGRKARKARKGLKGRKGRKARKARKAFLKVRELSKGKERKGKRRGNRKGKEIRKNNHSHLDNDDGFFVVGHFFNAKVCADMLRNSFQEAMKEKSKLSTAGVSLPPSDLMANTDCNGLDYSCLLCWARCLPWP